jgi:hypothetical protein
MTEEPLLRGALERVARQADGNGVDASDVDWAGGSLDWHEFLRLVRCDVDVRVSTGSFAGPFADESVHMAEDEPSVERAAGEYAATLRSHPKLMDHALAALRSRQDAGFDASKTPVEIESTIRRFGWIRTCPTCRGTRRVTCKPCGGRGLTGCQRCLAGKVHCMACRGSGGVNRYDSTKQQQVRTVCMGCAGTGRGSCPSCGGSNQVRCAHCDGTGAVDCRACEASGFFTEITSVGAVGALSGPRSSRSTSSGCSPFPWLAAPSSSD